MCVYVCVYTVHIFVIAPSDRPHVIKIKWNAWKWKIAVQLGTSVFMCVCVCASVFNNLAGLYYLYHQQTETSIIITIFDTFSFCVLDNSNNGNSSKQQQQ